MRGSPIKDSAAKEKLLSSIFYFEGPLDERFKDVLRELPVSVLPTVIPKLRLLVMEAQNATRMHSLKTGYEQGMTDGFAAQIARDATKKDSEQIQEGVSQKRRAVGN